MSSTELDQIKKDVEAIKTDTQASLRGIERSLEQDMSEAKASVDKAFETADAKPVAESTSLVSSPDQAAESPSPATPIARRPCPTSRWSRRRCMLRVHADPMPAKTGA